MSRSTSSSVAPGVAAAARFIAASIAALFVASPDVWKTTTFGGRMPVPKVFSVRWFASYADLPGIEKLWNQRLRDLARGEDAEEREGDPGEDDLPAVPRYDVSETSQHASPNVCFLPNRSVTESFISCIICA